MKIYTLRYQRRPSLINPPLPQQFQAEVAATREKGKKERRSKKKRHSTTRIDNRAPMDPRRKCTNDRRGNELCDVRREIQPGKAEMSNEIPGILGRFYFPTTFRARFWVGGTWSVLGVNFS